MKLNNVDLNKIRIFHAVVKNRGYQAASDELGLTRSAISQAMTTLESQIGVQLFQRKGRRLFPTQKAKKLSDEFEVYQKSLVESLRRTKNESHVEGEVRIGAYYEFAKVWLTPIVHNICEQHPDVSFKFIFNSPSKLKLLLETGKIDMCFSIFAHQGSNEIQPLKLMEQELVLISPKKYLNKASQLESLLQLPLIEYYSSHVVLPRWIKTHFGKKRPKINPKIYAASAEMLLEFVQQGLGVGIIPLYLLDSQALNKVGVVRPTENKLKDYVWLNQFSGQFENSAHKAFYDEVRSAF